MKLLPKEELSNLTTNDLVSVTITGRVFRSQFNSDDKALVLRVGLPGDRVHFNVPYDQPGAAFVLVEKVHPSVDAIATVRTLGARRAIKTSRPDKPWIVIDAEPGELMRLTDDEASEWTLRGEMWTSQ